ncbi:MAG TPA: hypothetical protein VKB76_20515 [Ktedonobacterales bacterium]|nr:hypothetical protein [Ktedonobacterales bacterium]
MAVRFSVSINTGNGNNDGGTRRSELQQVIDVLQRIEQAVIATQASGTVTDRNGLAHTYTYTPTASA